MISRENLVIPLIPNNWAGGLNIVSQVSLIAALIVSALGAL